jgi:hypothetical protein
MAFALLGAALLGYWLGSMLDSYFDAAKPYWTAALIALFSLAYIAKVVIDLSRS